MGGLTVGGEEAEWTAGPSLDFTSLLDPCGCWPRALARQGRESWRVQETLLLGQVLSVALASRQELPGLPGHVALISRTQETEVCYLPCCSLWSVAPQLPISCWPEETPL